MLAACRSGSSTSNIPDAPPSWLVTRAAAQRAAATGSPAYYGFGFRDRRAESGIRFESHVVDDAGKTYKKVHYDHGTGVAAADVDGDGRPDLFFASQLGSSELWRNLGGARFEDITDSAGLTMPDAIAVAPFEVTGWRLRGTLPVPLLSHFAETNVRTYTTVSRQGGKLKLLNLTKRIQDLLAITKLLTVFDTYDSEAEAIKSYK